MFALNKKRDLYIDRYLDGALSDEENDAFETRCLEDKAFFELVRRRRLLREQLAQAVQRSGESIFADYAAAASPARPSTRRMWRYGFAVVTVLAVAMLIYSPRSEKSFRLNPQYERLLGKTVLRSDLPGPEILSPHVDETVGETIPFSWTKTDTLPYQVTIMNNRGAEVSTFSTSASSATFSEPLASGTYYWHLIIDGNIVYTGKFRKDSR